MHDFLTPLIWSENQLIFTDQRLLPHIEDVFIADKVEKVAQAISDMVVRGAPAIGIAAAFGWALGKKQKYSDQIIYDLLIKTRPTARDLSYALEYMLRHNANPLKSAFNYLQTITELELELVKQVSSVIHSHDRILTHCHSGSLAMYNWGTALGGINYAWQKQNKEIFLWIKETRPRVQGRITAWEARKRGIPHCIIVDSTAAYLISCRKVDKIIVGADRIAKNFDVANKIGTLSLAITARHFNIPFYVAAPKTTFDEQADSGASFIIEERDNDEIKAFNNNLIYEKQENYFFNPAFDIVPHCLITAIITEQGLIELN